MLRKPVHQLPWLAVPWFLLFTVSPLHGDDPTAGGPGPAAALKQPGELAETYVQEFTRRHRAEHKLRLQDECAERLRESPSALKLEEVYPQFSNLDPVLQARVVELLGGVADERRQDYDSLVSLLTQEVKQLRTQWVEIRTRRNQWDLEKSDYVATEEGRGLFLTVLSYVVMFVNRDTIWIWFCALLALSALGAISWHDRRHEIRRRGYGGKGRGLKLRKGLWIVGSVVLIAVFIAGFDDQLGALLSSDEGAPPDVRTRTTMRATIDDHWAEANKIEANDLVVSTSAFEPLLKAWAKEANEANDDWEKIVGQQVEANVLISLQGDIAAALQEDAEQLGQLQEERGARADGSVKYEYVKWSSSAIVGALLAGVTLGLTCVLIRGINHRQDATENICPMCLGRNTLHAVNAMPRSGDRTGGIHDGLPRVVCQNEFKKSPDDGEKEECAFSFLKTYQQTPKLYFPTLGVPGAGKTHWMLMEYHELGQNNFEAQADVVISKVKSNKTEETDRLVAELLDERQGPMPTQHDELPEPLLFDFQDSDRWGRSNALLSLFDYSGEVTRSQDIETSAHRRRALSADGYLFFIDPTKRSAPQADALNSFSQELRVLGNIKSGRALRAPVALCITKIDMLNEVEGRSSGEFDWFYDELTAIDGTGEDCTLETLRKRSDLGRRLAQGLWSGWKIEQQIRKMFGARHMFFPLTPVGIDGGTSATLDDHGDRVFIPWGIHAPLFWLLHMNGYMVLEEKRSQEAAV